MAADGAQHEFLGMLRQALRSDEPIDFLMTVSGMLTAVDSRSRDPFDRSTDGPTLDLLIDSLVETDYAETTAALTVIRALLADQGQVRRISAELTRRRQPMPPWLDGLQPAQVDPDAWSLIDPLGDGDNYMVGVTLGTGQPLTFVVYVDHNLGRVVKDAFVVPQPIGDVISHMASIKDPDVRLVVHPDSAQCRAEIAQAIERGAHLYPPPQTDSWPMCRPLVEWMERMLPPGGRVQTEREWSQAELQAIADDFFASEHGTGLDDDDRRGLLDNILWFGSTYTACDPWRWSPVNVEILMVDWFPRKIMAEASYLAKMPALLRPFIRFCHQRRGIPGHLTDGTLAAVDRWEPEYQRTIRSARLQGPAALLASVLPGFGEDDKDDFDFSTFMLERLEARVGGRIPLMNLDTQPLPDEPFAWDGIAEDIRPVLEEILDVGDAVADKQLDREFRTAMRRLLGRVAVSDPAMFRRKASPTRGAAAVAWLIHRANRETTDRILQVQELMSAFGISGSVSQRAEPMLRALGIDPHARYGYIDLGAPDLLTSQTRAELICVRDLYLARADQGQP